MFCHCSVVLRNTSVLCVENGNYDTEDPCIQDGYGNQYCWKESLSKTYLPRFSTPKSVLLSACTHCFILLKICFIFFPKVLFCFFFPKRSHFSSMSLVIVSWIKIICNMTAHLVSPWICCVLGKEVQNYMLALVSPHLVSSLEVNTSSI